MRCYKKALKIQQTLLGKWHPDVALSYNNIGYTYYEQGNYANALEYSQRALEIQKSISGELHLNVAVSYSSIGYVYKSLRNYSKALSNFQKSLFIYLNLYGNNNNNVVKISTIIYNLYCFLLEKSSKANNNFKKFISDYAYTFTTPDEEEYYLLEYNNWYLDSVESIFNNYKSDNPANIVLMKDGKMGIYHLDNTIGCEVSLKYIWEKEKEGIVKAYNNWKVENIK